jgi:hypothetical protein
MKFRPCGHGAVSGFGTLWLWDIYRTATLARGTPSLRLTKEKDNLLLVSVEGAALLGVDEVVPTSCQH